LFITDLNMNSQSFISAGIILIFVSILLVGLFLGLPLDNLLLLLAASLIFFIAFLKTDFALVILIFSMLLSPEIRLGGITGREVVLRADDLILLIVFFGWMARVALNKELGMMKITPLNRPILIYIFICIAATLLGAVRGFLSIKNGMFYILKYLEYFVLYFMVTNNLNDKRQVKMFVYLILMVSLIISIYAWKQHFSGIERVSAPFEGKAGEANTLGGYFILIMSISLGLLLNSRSVMANSFFMAVIFFALPALLFTLSRGSWLGFIPAVIAMIFLSKKGKLLLLIGLVSVLLIAPMIIPNYVKARVKYTFDSGGTTYSVLGMKFKLEDSASARVNTWLYSFGKWRQEPFIGYGVASPIPILDNQYARVIVEVGLIGFLAFIWILRKLFVNVLMVYRKLSKDGFACGLSAGFLAGFIGLIVHAFGAETFILIRIMEPFWFLAAIIMVLPEIYGQENGLN
jgi:O-antigen ligase